MQWCSFVLGVVVVVGVVMLGVGGVLQKWWEVDFGICILGCVEGYFLCDLVKYFGCLLVFLEIIEIDIVIFGFGVVGLIVVWKLECFGYQNFFVIDGLEVDGNVVGVCYGQVGEYVCLIGVYYLLLFLQECLYVCEIFVDLGVILCDVQVECFYYDECYLLYVLDEWLLVDGYWYEGLLLFLQLGEQEELDCFNCSMDSLCVSCDVWGWCVFMLLFVQVLDDLCWLVLDCIIMW